MIGMPRKKVVMICEDELPTKMQRRSLRIALFLVAAIGFSIISFLASALIYMTVSVDIPMGDKLFNLNSMIVFIISAVCLTATAAIGMFLVRAKHERCHIEQKK
jgi:hypothetical protein